MTVDAAVNFDAVDGPVLKPSKLAHVVFRTANLAAMRDFYRDFLGASVQFESPHMAFMTYDDEHHRIAILEIPSLGLQHRQNAGFEHVAFTFPTLNALLLSYRQRKAKGIAPVWSVNHGPTTSLYYADPDGNVLETQYDNFDTDGANAWLGTAEFAENPIGVDFDPEELIARIKGGESLESLVKRPNVGPRGADTVPVALGGFRKD